MRDFGLSAFDRSNVTKGALGVFLRAVQEKRVKEGSYLLVEHLDRLSRAQVLDALTQFTAIINAGINIVTLTDRMVYSRETVAANPMVLLMSITIMAASHDESEKKSQRVSAAWANKKKQVVESGKLLTRKTPLWITVKNGKPILIKDRADVIKLMYEMALKGNGSHTIVKYLNANVPAWNKAKQWQMSYVQKVLNNVAVYGAIDIDGTIVEKYYPKILTKAKWHQITSLRKNRKTTQRAGSRKGQALSNLFSGLLKCGYCGAGMQMSGYVETRHGAHKRRKFVLCNGARTKATICACIQWDYSEFEESFLFQVGKLDASRLIAPKSGAVLVALDEKAGTLQAKIAEKSKSHQNLLKAIEESFTAGMAKRAAALESEIEKLNEQLSETETKILIERSASISGKDRLNLILKLTKEQQSKSDEEKRVLREALSELIRSIVDRIDMYPSGPSRNSDKAAKEDRYAVITLKGGNTQEIY
jgi:DNA invertase Pin-like site-specific DNA recombinase